MILNLYKILNEFRRSLEDSKILAKTINFHTGQNSQSDSDFFYYTDIKR